MVAAPQTTRAVAFFDGQNLFHTAKEAFGYNYPNYDPVLLAQVVCSPHGWSLTQTRFYTGVPDRQDDVFWNHFWEAKLAQMIRKDVVTFSRSLRYLRKTVQLPDDKRHTIRVGQEKGIDVRIALDIVRLAHRGEYDVAVIFSQDQDLSEAADDVRQISREQGRWIKLASAFPQSPTSRNKRGINKTDWIPINSGTYEACIDPRDYRPKAR